MRLGTVLLFGFACSFSVELENELASPPKVAFEFTMSGADELSGTLMIPVVLSRETDAEVTVSYSLLSANTATDGVDFTLTTGSLTFAPGEVRREIPVTIKDDNDESEMEESFDIALSAPVGATLDEVRAIHSIRIADHILPRATLGPATQSSETMQSNLVIKLDRPAEANTSIVVGVEGGAPAGITAADVTIVDGTQVQIPEGATMVNVPIGEKDDQLDEEDAEIAVFTLRGASPNLVIGATKTLQHSILDDDLPPIVRFMNGTASTTENGGGTQVTPTVALSAPSGRMVRVDYARDANDTANDADATVSSSPGTVTFMPGETSKQISVAIANDQIDEDNEDVVINLSNPRNATLGTPTTHTITINDNDTASVAFTNGSQTVDEDDAGGVTIRVRLSIESAKTVTVPFTVGGGSAESDDYNVMTASPLVFPPGTTQLDIEIDIVDNSPGSENDETFNVDLGMPTTGGATRGSPARHTVTIQE